MKMKIPMKKLPPLASACLALSGGSASAANIMLDFGGAAITAGYEILSPGHGSGSVSGAQTTWNSLTTAATTSSLSFSDGSAATGITLTFGQEAATNDNIIDFAQPIGNTTGLIGGSSTSGKQSLFGTGSIYGATGIHTAGKDGFFGGVNAGLGTVAGAIGLRLDGLEAGEYRIYVMGRNTNTNADGGASMAFYGNVGAAADTFDFGSLTALGISANTNYTTGAYAGQYNQFIEGDNFVAFDLTVAEGQSLFLASDGVGTDFDRGFLSMVQIVQIPEPSAALLGAFGFLALLRRRR